MPKPRLILFMLLVCAAPGGCASPNDAPGAGLASNAACVAPTTWHLPAERRTTPGPALFERLAAADVVLVGEAHDRREHHIWQAEVAAGLLAHRADLVIGLEMLPRRAQGALDRFVAGETSEAEFLSDSDWRRVWGFDFALYRPIFDLARLNRLRMVALNIDRGLVTRVSERGWDAVPEAERQGVTTPTPAPQSYLDRLAETFAAHRKPGEARDFDRGAPEFRRFVEAQLLWDRAMAEGIATARQDGGPLVLGVMGAGHVEGGNGVPYQLRALGARVVTLLPWDAGGDCGDLVAGLADAVFGIPPGRPDPSPPRLGITVERAEGGLRILTVGDGSIAAASGIQPGDVLAAAAGQPLAAPGELTQLVRRQAPGTWLPLTVQRAGETLHLIAKFPAERVAGS
jgi:uncharacterized iron-regulated protein